MIQKLDELSRQINDLLPKDFTLLKDDLSEHHFWLPPVKKRRFSLFFVLHLILDFAVQI